MLKGASVPDHRQVSCGWNILILCFNPKSPKVLHMWRSGLLLPRVTAKGIVLCLWLKVAVWLKLLRGGNSHIIKRKKDVGDGLSKRV